MMESCIISSVHYENYPSGHDYLGWGETLATGLISLIGDKNENNN